MTKAHFVLAIPTRRIIKKGKRIRKRQILNVTTRYREPVSVKYHRTSTAFSVQTRYTAVKKDKRFRTTFHYHTNENDTKRYVYSVGDVHAKLVLSPVYIAYAQ